VSDAAAEGLAVGDTAEDAEGLPVWELLADAVTLAAGEPVADADGEPVELRRVVFDTVGVPLPVLLPKALLLAVTYAVGVGPADRVAAEDRREVAVAAAERTGAVDRVRTEVREPEAEGEAVSDATADRLLVGDIPEADGLPVWEPLADAVRLTVDELVGDVDGEPVRLRRELLDAVGVTLLVLLAPALCTEVVDRRDDIVAVCEAEPDGGADSVGTAVGVAD